MLLRAERGTIRTETMVPTASATSHADPIAEGRARIDQLDRDIIALVQQRMKVSRTMQQLRMASGGSRIVLSREMEILAHYREALGQPGAALALTVLDLCRGRA